MAGGMRGKGVCRGMCMARGCAWQEGMHGGGVVCMARGMHGRGHAPPPDIGSMSGRYASYWNAFFLNIRNFSIDMGTMINVQIIR